MDDEDLLRRVAQRNEEAFRLLYARHSAPVYGLLCRLAVRHGDAAELLEETWLRGMRHLSLYRGQSEFRTWLIGIALNCYRDWRRRHPRDASLDELDARPVPARDPDEMVAVSQILASLPHEHRELIVLHDVEGFTHDEIAAALEIEPVTSQTRLSRARRAFRQRWDDAPASQDDPLSGEETARFARARLAIAGSQADLDRLVRGLCKRGLLRRRGVWRALVWGRRS